MMNPNLLPRLVAILLILAFSLAQMSPAYAAGWRDTLTDQGTSTLHQAVQAGHAVQQQAQQKFSQLPELDLSFPEFDHSLDLDSLRDSLNAALARANATTRQAYQYGTDVFDKVDLLSLITGGGVVYATMHESLRGVPQDFQELLREVPQVAQRLKYRAGLRSGEMARSEAEVLRLFRKVPGATLMQASSQTIRQFLANKDASHIVSHQNGGSAQASNIFWELKGINRARGARNTTWFALLRSTLASGAEAVVRNSATIAKLGLTATAIATLVDVIVEAELQSIALAQGAITVDEFLTRLQQSAQRTALTTAAFYMLTVLAISMVPGLVPIFTAPALVTASQILLGSRLALPLLRLVPAL